MSTTSLLMSLQWIDSYNFSKLSCLKIDIFLSPLLSFLLLTWVYVLSQLLGYLLPTPWEDVVCYAFMAHQFLILCWKFHPSYSRMCWGTVNLSFLNWIISIISNVETDISWNDCKHNELILKVSKSQKEILGYSHTPKNHLYKFCRSLLKGAKKKELEALLYFWVR